MEEGEDKALWAFYWTFKPDGDFPFYFDFSLEPHESKCQLIPGDIWKNDIQSIIWGQTVSGEWKLGLQS